MIVSRRAIVAASALLAGVLPTVAAATQPGRAVGNAGGAVAATSPLLQQGALTQPTSDGSAAWVSAPALAPEPPTGSPPAPYPVALGRVGDIEFWQPNRGLLITGGSGIVPSGLYAYDGVSWHQLSTVCGGSDGRIAWAGPDEFWTIADQRPGQVVVSASSTALQSISLCHFENGQVVGSYAMPIGEPDSYQTMNAAACDSPSDCWFGGDLDSAGAFHLHWDGSTVTVVDAPQDHDAASMTVLDGEILESVQLNPPPPCSPGATCDNYGSESLSDPPVLHLIAPWDPANPFHDLFPVDHQNPSCGDACPPLPEYLSNQDSGGNSCSPACTVVPWTMTAFALSSDWRAEASDPQLWAVAGPGNNLPSGSQGAPQTTLLRYADGAWTEVVPNLTLLPPGYVPVSSNGVPGSSVPPVTPVAQQIAAEPNEPAAWVAVGSTSGLPSGATPSAAVARVEITGTASATVTDLDTLGTATDGIGPRGEATAIACPAPDDCWLATATGWLFHLTSGVPLPQDTDPNFAGVITYRPPDGGVPPVILDQLPPIAPASPSPSPQTPPTAPSTPPPQRRPLALVTHLRSHLLGSRALVFSFTLATKARVQVVAKRHRTIVSETRAAVLRRGRHTLTLVLDLKRWPTSIAFDAKPLAPLPTVPVRGGGGGGGGGAPPGGPTTIST
jgi:hypothetical protein